MEQLYIITIENDRFVIPSLPLCPNTPLIPGQSIQFKLAKDRTVTAEVTWDPGLFPEGTPKTITVTRDVESLPYKSSTNLAKGSCYKVSANISKGFGDPMVGTIKVGSNPRDDT